ncbi:MAG: RNA methyltransferase [Anaerolineae bacterium]|nr:RNA methyltransferase [Anaerolineae bacterium]NIN97483.1 RNA methyltransferase [Anaerolineae bacterium]NIQ80412.1 RNA methyltransferase [Anaerolineae bacterium]
MIETGQEPVFVFHTESFQSKARGCSSLELLRASGAEPLTVSDQVMATMAATKTPQGILAVLPFPEPIPGESPLILVLDRLRDPGNLGTILRSAEAAGVGQAITVKGTVDVYSPKVVRGAMGAHFRLSILHDQEWDDLERELEGRQILIAEPGVQVAYYQVDWTQPTALIVGGEARGPGEEARALATSSVTIPMRGGAESLNVAVATSIMLFEAARQTGMRDRALRARG